MALTSIHVAMTDDILKDRKFVSAACDIASRANAKVDDLQGNNIEQTRLHAMAGIKGGTNQTTTEDETKKIVDELLKAKELCLLGAVEDGDYETGMKHLGELLHPIQDRAFHVFEAWKYRGIADAIFTDPTYMFCHGVRDLGVVSKLDLSDGLRGAVELTWPLDWTPASRMVGSRTVLKNWYLSIGGFTDFGNQATLDPLAMRVPGPQTEFLGSGFMFSISFGAAPGSLPPPVMRPPEHVSTTIPETSCQLTAGPGAMTRARDDTLALVKKMESAVKDMKDGIKKWDDFINLRVPKTDGPRATRSGCDLWTK